MSQYQHNWNRKSLDELVEFYNETIAPRMVADGLEPRTEPPTYQWLVDNGFSGLADTLRKNHDLTLTEFYANVVGVGSRDPDYDWGISSESMIEVFEQYFEGRKTRGNLAERTLRSRRSRLATFARTYESLHGHSDLERHLDDTYERPNEIGRCLAVFDVLNERLANDETKLKYYSEIRQFYEYLENLRRAQYNPVEPVSDQYDWERGKPDNPTVDKEGMRRIYLEANDLSQELLVLALGAWGLRPAEVASLHASQFVFDTGNDDGSDDDGNKTEDNTGEIDADDDADDFSDDYIQFEQRKNGPGTVSLMYGVEAVQTRIDELADGDWNGYLFPSKQSSSGHRTGETINNRFRRLADAAGVTVDGETPTAKMGRRLWYTMYNNAMTELISQLKEIADDQGSSSAEIVVSNYLSEAERRKHRREAFGDKLEGVFGDSRYSTV